jgi:hypothetical protein
MVSYFGLDISHVYGINCYVIGNVDRCYTGQFLYECMVVALFRHFCHCCTTYGSGRCSQLFRIRHGVDRFFSRRWHYWDPRASILSISEPIMFILFAVVIVDERLLPAQWFGVLLIIASLFVMEMPRKKV